MISTALFHGISFVPAGMRLTWQKGFPERKAAAAMPAAHNIFLSVMVENSLHEKRFEDFRKTFLHS
ncbi:MAG: hypothetical protein IJT50_08785 [Lentisphaeria bacterium]|nr:hypothetical protein [Lentisphaeria bacterium]